MASLLLAVIYLAFVSLGLPDALLGAAWPTMYVQFGVPVSWAGAVSLIISAGTVVSSLLSDRLTRRFGPGRITAVSVAMTAAALFGFSVSGSFWLLCLWAVPYGLGAGGVDACLNNYVALHYASRHMSWLHCMWGLGCSVGPAIMGWALTGGHGWSMGYRVISILQVVLTAGIVLSLPLWKRHPAAESDGGKSVSRPLSLREIFAIPGAKQVMVTFFCYCALEQTTGLWASSYLVLHHGLAAEAAASFASMFYIGITVGRFFSGFVTFKLNDTQMVRLGAGIAAAGILVLFLPLGANAALAGLVLVGLGCAPVYPCIIHSTPDHFGAERSQAVIGVQMASAYVGTSLMPPLFGFIADHVGIFMYPVVLGIAAALMAINHEALIRVSARAKQV